MAAAIIIPARLESTRLSRKALLAETGKPLVQHVYEAAQAATLASFVAVATDSLEIAKAVWDFGGVVITTASHHCSGSDRVAEAVSQVGGWGVVVCLQCDEPEIMPSDIDATIRLLQAKPDADIATIVSPLRSDAQEADENCVKARLSETGEVLQFSRRLGRREGFRHQHVGLYAYRVEALRRFVATPATEDEKRQRLEQLRAQAAGLRFFAVEVADAPKGVDTIQDYQAFVRRYRR